MLSSKETGNIEMAKPTQVETQDDLIAEATELFLPIHYKIGMALEDALRCGQLSRKQVAILWLMRTERDADGHMRRKDIERLLASWFETSSPTITRALRDMADAPLKLVRLVEDPDSGREKQVILTPKGERFLHTMEEEGKKFLQPFLAQMPPAESRELFRLLRKGVSLFEKATKR